MDGGLTEGGLTEVGLTEGGTLGCEAFAPIMLRV